MVAFASSALRRASSHRSDALSGETTGPAPRKKAVFQNYGSSFPLG